jgi:prevent-host-death family protein
VVQEGALGGREITAPAECRRWPRTLLYYGRASRAFLKAECDFRERKDEARFSYSLDGRSWTPTGSVPRKRYTLPHFEGYRFGLFNFATKRSSRGVPFQTTVTGRFGSTSGWHPLQRLILRSLDRDFQRGQDRRMQTVTIREAKARLNALVEAAERGEQVVLMRGSRLVAAIVPVSPDDFELAPTRRRSGFGGSSKASERAAPASRSTDPKRRWPTLRRPPVG